MKIKELLPLTVYPYTLKTIKRYNDNCPKMEHCSMVKDAGRMANKVDPDQTALLESCTFCPVLLASKLKLRFSLYIFNKFAVLKKLCDLTHLN